MGERNREQPAPQPREELAATPEDQAWQGPRKAPELPLDVRPDPRWPGRNGQFDDQVTYKIGDMRDLAVAAETLARDLSTFPDTVGRGTGGVMFGPKEWVQAAVLTEAHWTVSQAVTTYVGQIVGNLQAAADAIRLSAAEFEQAEQAGRHNFDRINGRLWKGGSET